MTNTIERTTNALLAFLRDEDQRVLALKGPWGIGKSFFVRSLLKNYRDTLPPFVAFASVFGSSSLTEVRAVVSSCVEPTKAKSLATAFRKFSEFFSSLRPSVYGFAMNIPDVSNALIWYLAKNYGLLVILDDLERVNANLSLDELLGFASSLTENSKAKVLLIFNEERLAKDKSQDLRRYREKVIDAELKFQPSTEELVAEFLGIPAVHGAVTQCLNVSGGANIRLIFRIKRALRYLQGVLTPVGITMNDDDLNKVARIVWYFYVSPTPVTPELLRQSYAAFLLGPVSSPEANEEQKQAVEFARLANLERGAFDLLIIEYLSSGFLSGQAITTFVSEFQKSQEKMEYQRRSREAFSPYANNFLASDKDVVSSVERLLDDYADKIDLQTLKADCDFVAGFDRSTDRWWIQHVEAIAPKLSLEWCGQYLEVVAVPRAREILEKRQDELTRSFDPKATIRTMLEKGGWGPGDMAALESLPVQYYVDWFRKDDSEDFLVLVRSFINVATPSLREKLFQALRTIAADNVASEKRVYKFIGIPSDDKAPPPNS